MSPFVQLTFAALTLSLIQFGNCDKNTGSPSSFTKFLSGTLDGTTNYTIVLDPQLNWKEAGEACAALGLVLAGFDTVEQLDFVKQLAESAGLGNGYWDSVIFVGGIKEIGGSDYVWIENGQIVPSFFWNPGEPNNQHSEEGCATIWNYYVHQGYPGGNDIPCAEPWPFICKTKDESPPIESTSASPAAF